MGRYVVRRLLQMILVLFGASLILFVSLFVLPGDPIGTAGGERASSTRPSGPCWRSATAWTSRCPSSTCATSAGWSGATSGSRTGSAGR